MRVAEIDSKEPLSPSQFAFSLFNISMTQKAPPASKEAHEPKDNSNSSLAPELAASLAFLHVIECILVKAGKAIVAMLAPFRLIEPFYLIISSVVSFPGRVIACIQQYVVSWLDLVI
jgi:hypothetical protein